MSRITTADGTREIWLPAITTFGADATSLIRLEHEKVSSPHARLTWTGSAWRIRDTGSTNGTWLNGERVKPGEERDITPSDTFVLGSAQSGTWRLVDGGPPRPLLMNTATSEQRLFGDAALELPGVGPVRLTPQDGRWLLEVGDRSFVATEGMSVPGAEGWRLFLGTDGRTTAWKPWTLSLATLEFTVSDDQEHVTLTMHQDGKTLDLDTRSFWSTLMILAQERIEEGEAQKARDKPGDSARSESESGWMDMTALERATGANSRTLDVHITRVRDALEAAGVVDAEDIVDSRRNGRRINVPANRLKAPPRPSRKGKATR